MKNRLVALLAAFACLTSSAPAVDYLGAARKTAQWLSGVGVDSDQGRRWPVDPEQPETFVTHLYSGSSGVVLFFLEAHHLTGEAAYLREARAGADYLLATLPTALEQGSEGLYTGGAGVGFALAETYRATADERYREGARRTVSLLRQAARVDGQGVEWVDSTDIISGSAGIGLFLLYAARTMDMPEARELARQAGRALVERALPAESGVKWAINASFPRLMPNFSHGTAGVAYFLATLYQETGERLFLEKAVAGARYLQSVAETEGDVCLIFHHEPGGEQLHYLSWCHGPPGTARIFYRLFEITKDREWMQWVTKSARAVLASGIPEKRTPGFWNNVSQCCGSAGVAEFFLSLDQLTGERKYLDFAKRVTEDLLARATSDEKGMRWTQAEHRVQPDLLQAQTGYMQGAAGMGIWLLRLYAFEAGKKPGIGMPDSPF